MMPEEEEEAAAQHLADTIAEINARIKAGMNDEAQDLIERAEKVKRLADGTLFVGQPEVLGIGRYLVQPLIK